MKRISIAPLVAAAAAAWAPAFGSSLTSIGVLDPTDGTTAYSTPYAVSQDGTYVAGESMNVGGIVYAVVWSASDGLVALPCPSGANTRAIGVVTGVGSNAGNIIVIGLHEGYLTQRYYKAPLSSLGSGSWADCAAAGGFATSDMRGGSYNDLRNAVPDDTGWPPLGAWYTAGKLNSTGRDGRLRGDPFIGWDGASPRNVTSESAYGMNVGRGSESPSAAFYESSTQSYSTVPGSEGVRADGIGISPSFGSTNVADNNKQWICGQVLNYNGANAQGFRWMRGDASMTFLGTLPGHDSSVAYTIADNGVTAGRSYISGGETAVVWDTSGTWDTTGTAKSIAAVLAADGADTSMWSSLVRVYAASDDGKVLAGFGIWAADNSTRGFVAVKTTVAPPPVVQITHISWSSPNVVIDFTSSNTADTTAKFTVQQASTLVNAGTVFADVSPAAGITGSAGSFQATFAPTANPQFYRISRLP